MKEGEGAPSNEVEDEWQDILGSGCIMKKLVKAGSDPDKTKPVRGDRCEIKLTGRLQDTAKVIENEDLVTVTVGENDTIAGIDLILCLMELGEVCQLKISARFAYGSKGREPDIPPNASVDYDVELVKILGPLDVTKLTVDEKLKLGDYKRNKGNSMYSHEEYNDAIMLYGKAISILDDHHNISGVNEEKLQEVLDLRIKCYNNLAAAQLKMEAYEAALKSCDTVLACQPKNVKALFRKGKVLGLGGELVPAIKILREALTLEPETKIIHQELSRLVSKQKKESEKEKAMYRRMFGIDKDTTATATITPTSASSFSKWSVVGLVGAAATVVASIVIYKCL